MDKILITMFKNEYATAILNSQEKLNPDKDAYIDNTELQGVLNFFGVDDVSKLLKEDFQSVFQNQNNNNEKQPNTDVVEITQTKAPSKQSNEAEEAQDSEDTNNNDELPAEDIDTALNKQGTAANELECITSADLALASVGTPYAQQMEILQNLKNARDKKGLDTSDVESQIDALKTLVEDYLREHPEAMSKNVTVKKIKYGHNKDKEALLSHSFNLTGNKAVKPDDQTTETDNIDNNNGDSLTEINPQDENNNTDAEISYNIDFRTLNPENKFNWHFKGTVNAGSDNSDIHFAGLGRKIFKNGGEINFSGNFRQTIEDKHNITNLGGSLDYKNNKFSTGVYAMRRAENLDDVNIHQERTEMYGRYGTSLRGALGYESLDKDNNYYYVKGNVQGKREFPESGLSLNGSIGVEYGIINNMEDFDKKPTNLELKANGGVTFKGNGFNADLSANIATTKLKAFIEETDFSTNTTRASFLGRVSTDNFDLTTNISAIKTKDMYSSSNVSEIPTGNKVAVTTSIVLGIKKVFGENVIPTLSFNTGNYEGANKNLSVGVVIVP